MYAHSQAVMLKELEKNDNPPICKQLIKAHAKEVEERVYWFHTVDEQASFLNNYWLNQVPGDPVLKDRITKITDDKLNQLFAEIEKGELDNDSALHELTVDAMGSLNLADMAADIPIFDHKYFSANHPKTKEAQQKIRRMNQEQREFRARIARLKQKEEMRRRQKKLMDEEIKRSLEKQRSEKLKQHVVKTIEVTEEKKREREQQAQKFKEFLKQYKSSKPLHVLMEEEYTQKVVLPSIEEGKKKLEEFTSKKKPSLEEINEHERNYLESKNTRESRIVVANQTIDVFKSKFYLEEERRLHEGEEYETIYDQMEKKKRYSQIVKQNFKPRVSSSLRESLHQSILQKSAVRESLDRSEQIERGKLYLQYMRSLKKNREKNPPLSERKDRQKVPSQSRYTNYLQNFKQSRHTLSDDSQIFNEWEKEFKNKNLNDVERRERVLLKSKQLEEKAFRQEQFVYNNIYGKPQDIIEKKKEIDDKIISSIRAKVAILKDVQGES